jgi:alpha/beta superfamily hydrolase
VTLFIPAPHGQLEALLQAPAGAPPAFSALICHPHPRFGGTLHNKVVYHTAKALVGLGGAALRFNFRGVGASTGSYDEGRGEGDDVRTALDHLVDTQPGPYLLAGFSFGSWVGVPIGCADPRVSAVLGIGLPVRLLQAGPPPECDKPVGVIQGSNDSFGPLEPLREALEKWPRPVELQVVEGADHFFTDHLEKLREAVSAFARRHLPVVG